MLNILFGYKHVRFDKVNRSLKSKVSSFKKVCQVNIIFAQMSASQWHVL